MCEPYIPLSWLRETWQHVKMLEKRNVKVTYHDVWLWLVRQEISRLTIMELTKEKLEMQRMLRGETENAANS